MIYLFILEAGMGDHAMILTGLSLSIVVASVAFLANWITLEATKGVIILGTIVFGFGGWVLAVAVFVFFVSGSILTGYNRAAGVTDTRETGVPVHLQKRRDGYQVWANGFWLAFFCIGWFIMPMESLLTASLAAIATATADTWATEIGTLNPGKTRNIITFDEVEAGTDGGISLKGTLAAVVGSLIISLFIFFSGPDSPVAVFLVVFVFGITGCFIDSFIGGILIHKNTELYPPKDYSGNSGSFTNSFVNWASTGISGLLAFLTIQIFL